MTVRREIGGIARGRDLSAFTIVETLVALALFSIIITAVVATFSSSVEAQGKTRQEWAAVSLAEQRMELLAALPKTDGLLAANSTLPPDVVPGSEADARCDDIPLGPSHYLTSALAFNAPVANGSFEVCSKVTQGNPFGSLLNVRVVVLFASKAGTSHVLLQTIR